MQTTSEIQEPTQPDQLVEWVALAGLLLLAKGTVKGVQALAWIAKEETYFRAGNAFLLADPHRMIRRRRV